MLNWLIKKQQTNINQLRAQVTANKQQMRRAAKLKPDLKKDLVSVEGLGLCFALGCLTAWSIDRGDRQPKPRKRKDTPQTQAQAQGKSQAIQSHIHSWLNTAILLLYYLDKFKRFYTAKMDAADATSQSPETRPPTAGNQNSTAPKFTTRESGG